MRKASVLVGVMVLVPMLVRADDTDPEPKGSKVGLSQLAGKWNVARMILKGAEGKAPLPISYTFQGDKVEYNFGGKTKHTSKVEIDRKRNVLTMTREGSKIVQRYFFKIEQGELYLLPDRSNDPKAKPDFSGNALLVMILEKEKK